MKKHRSIPSLYTHVSGSGPTVVLLHGIFSSSRYWEKVQSLLKDDYKVIAIDLLGFGMSPKPRGNRYDYEDHIAAINKALEANGVTQPFILIGHSMGALIALRYSIEHESRVQKLVLTNMPMMIGAREVRREILGSNRLHRFGLSRGIHRLTWAIFRLLHRLRWLPKNIRRRLTENDYFFQHNAISRIRSFYNLIGEARVDADLARVNVATTLISGLHDRKIYLENLSRRIKPSAQVKQVVVETGHHVPWQFPELIKEHVK